MKRGPLLFSVLPCAMVAAWLAIACSSTPDTTDEITVTGPNPGDFSSTLGGVGPVFERRCGSFDCHGNDSRAMRIYSQNGLRLPNEAGILPGTAATTPDEVSANYRSIIAVEPEQMNSVVKDGADVYSLLITKKPLNNPSVGGEFHKGGTLMIKGDDTDKCITGWLTGKVDKNVCTAAAQLP
jgi:hypothetical protein